MLQINKIETKYNKILILKGISIEIVDKEVISLIGSNGAGKTTTINTISGLIIPEKGTIEFMGHRIDKKPPHEIVKLGIIQVPEGRRLFPEMTVIENLEMGAYRHLKMPKLELEKILDRFIVLRQRKKQLAGSLSGGEQQMLAIGRALMAAPKLLMLDEPTLGLAPLIIKNVFDTIKEINSWGTTIFLIEQNAKFALEISNRAYVIENGNILMEGKGVELLNDDNVRKAYLGI